MPNRLNAKPSYETIPNLWRRAKLPASHPETGFTLTTGQLLSQPRFSAVLIRTLLMARNRGTPSFFRREPLTGLRCSTSINTGL
jgi:hypothetical protein